MGDGEAEWFKDLMALQGEGKKEKEGDTQSQKPLERGPVGGAELQLWCRMELQQGVHLLTPSSMPGGLRMLAVPNLRPIVH